MKKTVVAIILLIGTMAMAQQERGRHHGGDMKDLTPEQIAALKTKKMTLALDLTQAQQKEVKTIHLESAKLRKAKMEERKALKEKGEVQKPTSEERYVMQMEKMDRQIAHKAEMKEILSQEQYEKWEKMALRKGKQRKGKMNKNRADRKK